MQALRARLQADARVRLTCFVTGANVSNAGTRQSDPFYAELNSFGHDDAGAASPAVADNIRLIADAPQHLWIRNPQAARLQIGPDTNDGIVNTARQTLAGATLGVFAVADHADVIGDYDRTDHATGLPMATGIFHSGAGFSDDEFFDLYGRVAAALTRSSG